MLKGESEFLSVWVSFHVSADCCAGKIYVMEEEHSGEYWLFVQLCSEFFKILTTKKNKIFSVLNATYKLNFIV